MKKYLYGLQCVGGNAIMLQNCYRHAGVRDNVYDN